MANDIGIKIGVDGEREFKTALTAINSQLKNLSSEMKATVTSMAGMEVAEESTAKKQDILGRSIDATKQKISLIQGEYDRAKAKLHDLEDALEQSKQEFGENSDEALDAEKAYNKQAKAVNDLGTKLNQAQTDLNNMEREMRETRDTVDDLGDAMEDAGQEASSFGEIFKGTFAANMAMKGLDIAVDCLRSGIDGMMSAGQDFTSSMSQVAATMGITTEEINAGSEAYETLAEAAKQAGATTPYSASEAADALNYLALAGYDAATAAEVLPSVLNLAAAGGMDLADASDLATDAMATLNIEASNQNLTMFGDKMAVTASKANTSVQQLGEAILTVGGTANTLSGGVTEVNAALGVLANRGIKGAEGGTHLRNIILALTAPTDKAALALKDLGIEVYDNEGKMRSLNDIFLALGDSLTGLSEGEKTNVLASIFNKTDLSAVNGMLAGCGAEFTSLATAIDNCDGAMQNMANTQLNNLSGDLSSLKSAAESVGISLYSKLEPALRAVVQGVTSFLQNLQRFLPVIAGVTVAVGSFAIAVNMSAILSSVTGALRKMKAAMLLLNTTMAANPIVLVVSLIAGLVAALVVAYNTSETFRNNVNAAFQAVKDVVTSLAEGFKSMVASIKNGIQTAIATISGFKTKAVNAFNSIVTAIRGIPAKVVSIGANIVSGLWNGINSKIAWLKSKISGFCSGALGAIKSFFGIHSPSTVMRDQVGVMLVRGMAVGMIKEIPFLKESFVDVRGTVLKLADELGKRLIVKEEELNLALEKLQKEREQALNAEGLDKTAKAALEKQFELTEEALKNQLEAVKAFRSEYEKALEDLEKKQSDMANKLKDYGELFRSFKDDDNKEIFELGDLQSDIDAIERYGDALEGLKARGVSESLMTKIVAMGIDDATKYTEKLLSMTDEEYSEYMRLWEQKQKAASEVASRFYAEEMTSLVNEYVSKVPEALGVMTDDLYTVGQRAAQGLAQGIWSKKDAVVAAARAVAAAARAALQSAEGIHSPAKKWAVLGDYMAQGIGVGFERRMDAVAKTITKSIPSVEALAREQSAASIVNGIVGGLSSLNRGTSSQPITLQVSLDSKTIAQTIFNPLKDVSRQRGVSLG